MATFNRTVMLLTAFMLLVWTSACMMPGPMIDTQIDDLKGQLGTIGVVAGPGIPDVHIKVPARNIAEGMKEGAKVPLQAAVVVAQIGGGSEFSLLVLAAGAALSPAGAIIGGLQSAVSGDQTAINNMNAKEINEALADISMNEHLRDRFSSQLIGLQVFAAQKLGMTAAVYGGQQPDYRPLRPTGIDTVSEVVVKKFSLNGIGVVNPQLFLHLDAEVRLISAADNNQIILRHYSCSSATSTFDEWAAQDARKFREVIERCYDTIAKNAVTDLFVNNTLILSPDERPREPSGLLADDRKTLPGDTRADQSGF